MAPSQSAQLESIINEVLKNGDVQPLDEFLERDTNRETPMKCSQKFLTKLDKILMMSLDRKDTRTASLGLATIYKCGKNMKLTGGQGLSALIRQGLIKKMVQWFEKCQHLWIQHGPHWDESMFTLSENFLNALMVVHESCKEGTGKVTESFLYPVGQLAVDPRICVLIQKEAIRKYNLILDKIPVEFKKNGRILTSQEASDIMAKLAARILEGGDYDLQSSLMEALCRMATPEQRRMFADQWFSMVHVATAFAQISDAEFETACRKFLNMVNGMQGDRRRVYSYPCLEVYLGKYELLMPSDEKLEEFWIDFNLGSHSISFYFTLPDEEESHWETICINETEVQSYTVTEESKTQILQIKLSEVVVVGAVEGSRLTIHFSSALDILQAAQNVYGHIKNKCTPGVKKAGRTMTQGNSIQVVPESQMSLSETEKNTVPYVLSAPAAPAQMVTPAKMRMSESTAYISSSEGGTVQIIRSLLKPSTKDKDRTSLESAFNTNVKTCRHRTPQGSTNVGIKDQKKQVVEAKHAIVTEEEEEKSQDHYFVPDTQPRTGHSVSSWSKLSVSEMLMMPTQKMGSFNPEPNSSVVGHLERCSSARKLSVSDTSLFLQGQLHSELTQRLQQVVNERKKDPQYQEAAALQKKTSNSRGNSKDRSSGNDSSLFTAKVQQVQRNNHFKEESKGQMALEAYTVPTKTSVKTSTAETVQDQKESKVKDDTKLALSRKEKRVADVTTSMIKHISGQYEKSSRTPTKDTTENIVQNWIPPLINRPVFNMNMFSSDKKEIQKAGSQRKSLNKTKANSTKPSKDIYAFNIDSPVCIGGANKTSDTSNSGIHFSPARLSPNNKAQHEPVAKKKRYVRTHLFSDTDTDNALTEVSWLRNSARRSKPEVTKYQAPVKPKATQPQSPFADISPDFVLPVQKASKDNKKPNKASVVKDTAAPSRPHPAGRRSKRAAATSTKSYREPDTDGSDSESERPCEPKYLSTDNLQNTEKPEDAAQTKKNRTVSKQSAKMKLQPESGSASEMPLTSKTGQVGQQENNKKISSEDLRVKMRKNNRSSESYKRQDSINLHDVKKQPGFKIRPMNFIQETSKTNERNVIPAREQTSSLKDSLAACQASFCPSPPFIETMRSAERSAPTLDLTCSTVLTPRGSPLPASPKPPCQETPSRVPLLLKPHSTGRSKGKRKPLSFYKAEKNHSSSKTRYVPSPCSLEDETLAASVPTGPSAIEMCTILQHLASATQSPLSPSTQPLLTSTLCEVDKPPVASPPSLLPEDTVSQGCDLDISKVSSASLASSPRSSVNRKIKNNSTGAMTETSKSEKTPVTDRDLELTQPHLSGPSRKHHVSSSSSSEDDEREEKKKSKIRGRGSPRMKPRKLFKSFAEVSAVDELSHISSSNWEAEAVDGDKDMSQDFELPEIVLKPSNLVHQLNSEMKNKFQNHCKTMEIYNKQTMKTVQQHVSSMSTRLSKDRGERLEQVQKVLLEEIHNMEQDDGMLKNMEKDLTTSWKKQTTGFHSYVKQEIRRNETLRRALRGNACQSLEFEEEIITSEMDLLKDEMKSVQSRLLNEMLEREIQGVKRGLCALFLP